jgi:flagellar hook-associated protein 2
MDSSSIIQQLMQLERAPQKMLQAQQSKNKDKISAFQKIEDALTSLQNIVKGFNTQATFSSLKTTVANTSVLTATSSSTAPAGNHTVQVVSLAKSERQVSTGVASKTDLVFGTGTFSIDGGAAINVAAGQNSLQGIADAINASGAKVTASIINDGANYRLVVNGTDTTNHVFDFTGLGGPAPTLLGAPDPTYQAAAAAQLVVDGVNISGTSNTITGAIQGVTLNLLTEASTNVSIATDSDAITKKISDFVAAFNNVNSLLNAQMTYDASKSSGILFGDSALRSIQMQLKSLLTQTVSGATGSYSTLAQLGVTSDSKTGALSVDATKLSDALAKDYANVVDYFTHNGTSVLTLPSNQYGIAQQFNMIIDTMVHSFVEGSSSNGLLETRKDTLSKTNTRLDNQIDDWELRLEKMEKNMRDQYSRMETIVSNLQSQGSSLLSVLGYSTNSSSNK